MVLEKIEQSASSISFYFSKTSLVKEMDGATEDTLWTGKGVLTLEAIVEQSENLPSTPCVLTDGEVRDNHTTFRGSVKIPFQFDGLASFRFSTNENKPSRENFEYYAESMSYQILGQEKYIHHIKV